MTAVRLDADRHQWMDRTLLRLAAVSLLGATVLIGIAPSLRAPYYWRPGEVAACVLLLIVGARLNIAAWRGESDVRLLRLITYAVFPVALTLLLAPRSGPSPPGTPWILHPVVISCATAPLCFSRRRALAWSLAVATVYGGIRGRQEGLVTGVADAAKLVVISLAVGGLIALLRRRYDEAEESYRKAAILVAVARSEHERETHRAWWDLLIHDKVLGALLMAARSTTPNMLAVARTLANDALAAIAAATTREIPQPEEDWAAKLEKRAADLGLRPVIRIERSGILPASVQSAVVAAGSEALTNTAKHAGVDIVRIEGRQTHDDLDVRVIDAGPGIDHEQLRPGRMGVTRSIPGHMAEIGGAAEISSGPGTGTEVRLTWHRPQDEERPLSTWEEDEVKPFIVIALMWMAINVLIGLINYRTVRNIPGYLLGAALLGVGSHLVLSLRSRTVRTSVLGVVATLGAILALLVSTTPTAYPDGRFWFTSATVPLVVALSLSGRLLLAWALAGCGFVMVMTLTASREGWNVDAGYEPAIALVVFALFGTVLSISLARATRRVRISSEEQMRARAAARASTFRIEEGMRRMSLLTEVAQPLLRRIASGAVVTSEDRAECRRAEAITRDHLIAEALMDAEVRSGTRAARERGIHVVLQATSEMDRDDPVYAEALACFRRVTAALLRSAGHSGELIARWHPERAGSAGTIVVTAEISVGVCRIEEIVGSRGRIVDVQGESLMVEFAPLRG